MSSSNGTSWHQLDADDVYARLETDPDRGLPPGEVARRRDEYGPNAMPERRGPSALVRFLLQFHQPLIYILLAATLVTLFLQEYLDAAVIFGVVILNAVIGFLQETRAAQALEALAKTMTTQANVVRDGKREQLDSEDLVPGDVVLIQSGDRVPADLRVVHVRELQVDESALTGESLPVGKSTEPIDAETPLAERTNIAYSSALVTSGQGKGVVVGTGEETEVGRISEMISGAEDLATPLTRQIARFSHILLAIILVLAAATLVVGVLRGESWIDMFMAAVALSVGAIPEGLPAAITITLAIGVARMARRRAIIRKLPAVETLGSTTVICSDKTGTLTENQMTVQQVHTRGGRYEVRGGGYAPEGEIEPVEGSADVASDKGLRECLLAGLLANDSALESKDGQWLVRGDPTEGALITAAAKAGLSHSEVRQEYSRIDVIPFESDHKYMATLHAGESDSSRVVYVKGAVEAIAPRCREAINAAGEVEALEPDDIQADAEEMAARGLRVLAFARAEVSSETEHIDHEIVEKGLTFLGLQGMIDPPREEVISAIRECHAAGVQVKMITGDHALTAAAIAEQVGLDGKGRENAGGLPEVLTGRQLEEVSDDDLTRAVEDTTVFARVSPKQKLRLVRALQGNGHVVAMTGDGVNDGPALKQANIGVAMGITGTEVAQEAADMVLTDDNFASIEAAVEEGRGVFDNLTKFIVWTLPTNLGEGLLILVAVFLGITLPVLPLQVLWINMTTAVLLGLMLAFEPKEPDLMRRPPRGSHQAILTRELIGRIVLVGAILLIASFSMFQVALASGESLETARTVAINTFVLIEIFYLFNCRSLTVPMFRLGLFSNRWLLVGVAVMVVLQSLFTYAPLMNRLFATAPIGLREWGWILSFSVAAFVIVEIEKWLWRMVVSRKKRTAEGDGAQLSATN